VRRWRRCVAGSSARAAGVVAPEPYRLEFVRSGEQGNAPLARKRRLMPAVHASRLLRMAARAYDLEALLQLPVDERIQLAQELWDSVSDEDMDALLSVTPELREEIRRRLADYRRDPGSATDFHEFVAELLQHARPPER